MDRVIALLAGKHGGIVARAALQRVAAAAAGNQRVLAGTAVKHGVVVGRAGRIQHVIAVVAEDHLHPGPGERIVQPGCRGARIGIGDIEVGALRDHRDRCSGELEYRRRDLGAIDVLENNLVATIADARADRTAGPVEIPRAELAEVYVSPLTPVMSITSVPTSKSVMMSVPVLSASANTNVSLPEPPLRISPPPPPIRVSLPAVP